MDKIKHRYNLYQLKIPSSLWLSTRENPGFRKLRSEDNELQGSLCYIVSLLPVLTLSHTHVHMCVLEQNKGRNL